MKAQDIHEISSVEEEFLIELLFLPNKFKEISLVETLVETSLPSHGIHEMSFVQTLIEPLFVAQGCPATHKVAAIRTGFANILQKIRISCRMCVCSVWAHKLRRGEHGVITTHAYCYRDFKLGSAKINMNML